MRRFLWFIPLVFVSIVAYPEFIDLHGFVNFVTEGMLQTGGIAMSSSVIDAPEEKAAVIIPIVGTKTFRRFGFVTGAITTGDTLDIRLELAGQTPFSTGLPPSGTLACSNSSTTLTLATGEANTYKETVNLPSDCTVTNATVAVVINNVLGNFNGNIKFYGQREDYNLFYSSISSAGWAVSIFNPVMTAVDNNSNYMNFPGLMNVSSVTLTLMASNSNPNNRGNIVNLPFGHRVIGVRMIATLGAVPATVKLWNTDATLLEAVNVSSGGAINATAKWFIPFSRGYVFKANSPYRITLSANITTSLSIYHYSWANQTLMNQAVSMGQYIYMTTGNNPTVEANWTQSTLQRSTIYPLIDQVEVNPNSNTVYDSTIYDSTFQ